MNILKLAVLFIFCLMLPQGVLADTKPTDKPATMAKADTTKPVMPAKKKANKAALVIGKNLKVTMPLAEAIKLLGIPGSISINRGTESKLDSISIAYANHGIVLHSLNGKKKIEVLEILPQFKGRFVEGIKL